MINLGIYAVTFYLKVTTTVVFSIDDLSGQVNHKQQGKYSDTQFDVWSDIQAVNT